MSEIRLLVCSNRICTGEAWELTVSTWLGHIGRVARRRRVLVTLIHGGAAGADSIAGEVGERLDWTIETYPISQEDWKRLGKRAGRARNVDMFNAGKPTRALAFGNLTKPNTDSDDSGTGHMVKVCNQGGVIVTVVPRAGVLP